MGGGNTDVHFPGPTPQEIELEQMQLDSLKQQKQMTDSFAPFVLQQYGLQDTNPLSAAEREALKPQIAKAQADVNWWKNQSDGFVNPDNGSTKEHGLAVTQQYLKELQDKVASNYDYTDAQKSKNAALSALQDQSLALAQSQAQRVQDAINGKIGPSDALTNQQAKDFAALKEDQGRLGNEIIGDSMDNATAKSTSGIQALEALRKTYGSLKSQELNNIISTGTQTIPVYQSMYGAATPTGASQAQGGLLAPLAGLNGQYSAAYQPYQFQAQGQFNADQTTKQNRTNMVTGLISGGLQAGSIAATAAAMMSSATFKKNISTLSEADEDALVERLFSTPTHRYHYKTEDDGQMGHLGVITEEAPPEIVTEDGKHLSVLDYFGMVTVAIKVLSRKLDKIALKVGE